MSNTGAPNTWFSGKSAPEDQQGPSPLLLLGVAVMVYSPISAIITLACYTIFNYYRVSHKVIAGCAALYCIPYATYAFLITTPTQVVRSYNKPWGHLFAAIKDKHTDGFIAHNWWFWFTHQLWLSIAIGLTCGALWTTWKWIRRPAWEDNERIPGPIHRLRRRRVTNDISSDVNGPLDGATIGVDTFGVRVVQTEDEAKAHTLLAGGSGSGKTTSMMVGIRDSIRRGEPVCVIDLKGATDLPAQLAEWSHRYGRRFLHWSITDHRTGYQGPADGPAFYDPIGRGDPSRKKDLLIGSEKWDVEYYKSVNENYLQIAFQIADLTPDPTVDAFTDLAALLDIDKLKRRAADVFVRAHKDAQGKAHADQKGLDSQWWTHYPTVLDPYTRDVLNAAASILVKPEESERSAISNMAARVQKLRMSTAGHWLKRDPEHGRDIDLRRAADEGWVVVFSLDSSNYKATSQQVGGLIIQDLNTLSSELRAKPAPRPFHIYVDEFSAIGQDNILDLLARARDAKMPTTLSTQALADLKKADPAFLEQALGIVNCFMIHRANTEADAEIFAGLTGKRLKWRQRMGVEKTSGLPGGIGTGAGTGQGTVEQYEEYVVLPSEFQALKTGEMVYIAKSPNARVVHPVSVIREDEVKVAQAVATGTAHQLHITPTVVTPHEPSSPFGEPDDDLTEALPDPWGSAAATDEEPGEEQDPDELVEEELLDDLPTSPAATPALTEQYAERTMSQFDEPAAATAPPTPVNPATPATPMVPVIDPALYLGDNQHADTATAVPTPTAPAQQSTEPQQVTPQSPTPVEPQPAPTQPAPQPEPVPGFDPPPGAANEDTDDEEFAFGGGDVDWDEESAPWDPVDLGLPAGSGDPANLPTTNEKPSQ